MGRAAKAPGFYAVKTGRAPGVYTTWEDCEAQTKGFPNAKYKKFSTKQEAEIFAFGKPIAASTSTSQVTGASKRPTSTRRNPYDRPVSAVNNNASSSPERALRHQRILQAIASATAEWTEIYTDGACRGNGKAGSTAGVGVWFGRDHPKNLSERCPGVQTNNRAELIAIIRALEMTSRTKKIIIKTDSKYSISCIESWLTKWRANNFKTTANKPVMNMSLIMYLDALLSAKAPGTVKLIHVQAHVGLEGNEAADSLAGLGCTMPWREEYPGEWDVSKVEGRDDTQAREINIEIDSNDVLSAEELAEMERTQNFD